MASDVGHHHTDCRRDGDPQLRHGAVHEDVSPVQVPPHAERDRQSRRGVRHPCPSRVRHDHRHHLHVPDTLLLPGGRSFRRPGEQGVAERQQPSPVRRLHQDAPGRPRPGHHPGQRLRLPRGARGSDGVDGQQPGLPDSGLAGEALRASDAEAGRRHAAVPHPRRGAHRAREARRVRGGRRLRHGHDLRRAHRGHHLHVRGGHGLLLAAGAHLPGVRRHRGLLAAVARLPERLRLGREGFRHLRVEPAAARVGLVGRAVLHPPGGCSGHLQRDPHSDVPACRHSSAAGNGHVRVGPAVREDDGSCSLRGAVRTGVRAGGADGEVRALARGRRRAGALQLQGGRVQSCGVAAAHHVGGRGQPAVLPPELRSDSSNKRAPRVHRLHGAEHRPDGRAGALRELHGHDAHRRAGRPRDRRRRDEQQPVRPRHLRGLRHGGERRDALRLQAHVDRRRRLRRHGLQRLHPGPAVDGGRRGLHDNQQGLPGARL
mmetsp:Transcript_2329/g.6553  ORF Transcript_2329/g.6553 Transcript_2329/m.6553 type:complete len:487 (-) Transcript_2329:660-2120(-)